MRAPPPAPPANSKQETGERPVPDWSVGPDGEPVGRPGMWRESAAMKAKKGKVSTPAPVMKADYSQMSPAFAGWVADREDEYAAVVANLRSEVDAIYARVLAAAKEERRDSVVN